MVNPPKEFIDAHHHFLDVNKNDFQTFLGTLVPGEVYMPDAYQRDVVDPLAGAGVNVIGSVHIECMPDNGVGEVAWVDSLSSTVKAIVASCDLSKSTADTDLLHLKQSSSKVRGIRWILDCVGPFKPNTATHVATTRHDGVDYLRGSNGGYDGNVVPAFEHGFALLEKHGLSFDLQCAPVQLKQAASLFKKYPNIKVCIDHLGKPKTLLGPDTETNTNTIPNEAELAEWREGMKLMAALPNVYVKLSMLGWSVPGWIRTSERISLVRGLVVETVKLFGPQRCMVATNWWKAAALSDSDGHSDVGPTPVELIEYLTEFLSEFSDQDREDMFSGTASAFYRI